MAVSKRLRFEILRRDNHTCRYCGASGPEVKLVIDHVLPETLGGKTEPENLVTACEPCNSGKSSIAPDSPIVDDVKQEQLRWARAMRAAIEAHEAATLERVGFANQFYWAWDDWRFGFHKLSAELPPDWEQSVTKFMDAGLPIDIVRDAVRKSMTATKVDVSQKWRYFCGICWRELDQIREIALSLLAAEDEA